MRMLFPQLIKQVGKRDSVPRGGTKLFCRVIVFPSCISWTLSQEGQFKLIFQGNEAFLTDNSENPLCLILGKLREKTLAINCHIWKP